MLTRIRRLFDGAGWFPGLAVVLFAFALLAVLLELQSSDSVRWTGQRVTGTEIGGIVSYRWDGQTYSLDAQGYGSAEGRGRRSRPGRPLQRRHRQHVPPVGRGRARGRAGGRAAWRCSWLGLTRRRRWERRQLRVAPKTGQVLDQEFVTRHLRELRHGRNGD